MNDLLKLLHKSDVDYSRANDAINEFQPIFDRKKYSRSIMNPATWEFNRANEIKNAEQFDKIYHPNNGIMPANRLDNYSHSSNPDLMMKFLILQDALYGNRDNSRKNIWKILDTEIPKLKLPKE